MDTQMQNFWIESINKEVSLRLEWQLKYSKRFAKAAALQKGKDKSMAGDSNIAKHILQMEKDLKSRPGTSPSGAKDLSKEDKALMNLSDMHPASATTRSQLYEGISHHGEGRYAYLKKRHEKSPEEKYVFPILSSCVYGWKILDYGVPKCSPFARTRVVRDTFYRHSGIING